MLSKLRNIGKQTFVYGLGSMLNKLLGFILIPFYQSYIPIGNFGNLVYYETIIVFLTAILSFGISPAHQRFFYKEKENGTYGTFLFNNFFGCLVLAFGALLPLLLFSGNISHAITGAQDQSVYLQITLWTVLAEVLYILPLQVLQYEEKPISYFGLNALKLLLSFTLTILLLVQFQMGYKGIMLARMWGGVITLLIALVVIVLPRCTLKINLKSVEQSVRFGFPMVISMLGYTIFMVTDRFMLNWLSTPEEIGKYGFGLKIANFINLIFVQTIGMSYFPSVTSNESKEGNIRYYRKMLTYYCFIIGLAILAFLFFYKDILWIVGKNKDYWEGLKVVPVLSLSFMVMGMNYFVQVGLFLKNKTSFYLIPSFTAASVNIFLNYLLIPKHGMMGAGYSILSAQIVYTGLITYFSGKQLKIGFEWAKIFTIYFIAIAIFLFQNFFISSIFWLATLERIILLAIMPLILYKLNFFEPIEIQRAKEGLVKLAKRIKH